MKTREIELPSGRKVTVKPVGVGVMYRIAGHLPDMGASGEESSTAENVRAGIKMILECAIEPRFFFDLRNDIERAKDPLPVPTGAVDIDLLEPKDFWFLVKELFGEIAEAAENMSPLPETATH